MALPLHTHIHIASLSKCVYLWGTTALRRSPSRRWRCQSSGRVIVSSIFVLLYWSWFGTSNLAEGNCNAYTTIQNKHLSMLRKRWCIIINLHWWIKSDVYWWNWFDVQADNRWWKIEVTEELGVDFYMQIRQGEIPQAKKKLILKQLKLQAQVADLEIKLYKVSQVESLHFARTD